MTKLIAIFGPTTTGKTDLAIDLSRFIFGKFNMKPKLISADSRKIYQEMNIGVHKIKLDNKSKIAVQMVDMMPLDREYSLYDYKNEAERIIDQAHQEDHLPILFGGTGIYILSVIENWNIPQNKKVDHKKFGKSKPKYDTLFLSCKFDRQQIYKRIDKSVEGMFKKGLFEEFLSLAEKYQIRVGHKHKKFNALYETLAYREFIDYSIQRGIKSFNRLTQVDLEKIKYRIKKDIKNYARRQTAWHTKIKEKVILVEDFKRVKTIVEKFLFYTADQ